MGGVCGESFITIFLDSFPVDSEVLFLTSFGEEFIDSELLDIPDLFLKYGEKKYQCFCKKNCFYWHIYRGISLGELGFCWACSGVMKTFSEYSSDKLDPIDNVPDVDRFIDDWFAVGDKSFFGCLLE